jgi:HEAT repeat protein
MKEQYQNRQLLVCSERERVTGNLLTTMQTRLGLKTSEKQQQVSQESVLQALQSNEWTSRIKAVRALEQMDQNISVVLLVDILWNDENSFVRAAAARSLGGQKNARHRFYLLLALRDPEWRVRAATIEALSTLEGPQPIETYINALRDDEDTTVRMTALLALSRLGSQVPIEPLLNAQHDEDEIIQAEALEILLRRGTQVAFADLTRISHDEHQRIRTAANQSLITFGHHLTALMHGLKDEKKERQSDTTQALIALGMHTPLQPLLEALKDGDETIRGKTIDALLSFHKRLSQVHFTDHSASEDENAYTAAVDTLVAFSTAAPLWPLAHTLQVEDKAIWSVAMAALTKVYEKVPERVYPEFLLYCAQNDEDVIVQATAIAALQEQISFHGPNKIQQNRRQPSQSVLSDQGKYQMQLQSLIRFLQEKPGDVPNVLIESAGKQTLVLSCNYQSEKVSMQTSVIHPLEYSTSIQRLHAALKDQDDVIRHIASQMIEELEKSPWREGLLVSVDLPQSPEQNITEPVKLVFYGMSHDERSTSERDQCTISPSGEQGNLHGEEIISHLVGQLANACHEQWQKNLCERAHEMTGLKLFYTAGEEVPSENGSWITREDTGSYNMHHDAH